MPFSQNLIKQVTDPGYSVEDIIRPSQLSAGPATKSKCMHIPQLPPVFVIV